MLFNSNHYVPILKWKRAEQGALKVLAEEHKIHVTPLIQFVMPKQKPNDQLEDIIARFEEQTPKMVEKIIEAWGIAPVFVDVSLIFTTPLKAKSLEAIAKASSKFGGVTIPVIHLNDEEEIKKTAYAVAKNNASGLCLRLVCADFHDISKMNRAIAELVSKSGLNEKNIDLIVDIKETEKNGDKYARYFSLSQNIKNLTKWRTFIFASGSFPENLSECKFDEENIIPRIDWIGWKKRTSDKKLKRMPTFSDYTIQHPVYRESSQFFHPTSSIKYTLENEWLIMKGKKQKFELYLANAAELKKDKRFYGEGYSDGDKYIAEKAEHFTNYIKNPSVKGTGSTETWLRAGINHHLTLAAHQVANPL